MSLEKDMFSDLRSLIRETISEGFSELSTIQASNLLNGIAKQFPGDEEKLKHYKNIIVKNAFGLRAAYAELAKELGRTPERIEKIVSNKQFNTATGNPFGISGTNVRHRGGDEMVPELVHLDAFEDQANYLKNHPESLRQGDLATLNTFFTPETFDMINGAIQRIAERHNKQIEKIQQQDIAGISDPYTNQPIVNLQDPEVVVGLGAYYQSDKTFKLALNVQDATHKIETALKKRTIAGLRWVYSNAKNTK